MITPMPTLSDGWGGSFAACRAGCRRSPGGSGSPSRWARIPAGVLLIIGGCLAILPVFGLWMFPLGLMLLADDIPPLRRARDRALDWLERRRPRWFAAAGRV
jgi:hypothetical protein